MFRDRDAFHQGINYYVPGLQYTSDLVHGQPTAFSLGTPAVAAVAAASSTVPANSAPGTVTNLTWVSDAPYGRCISVKANADPGANCVIDIHGTDYLGQPMVFRYAPASGGVVAINGTKAFYRLTMAKSVTAGANAVTLQVGTLNVLGMPYKGFIDWAKEDGVPIVLTTATIVPAVLTDPATVSTGDPRGTYTPAITLNGAREIIIGLQGDNWTNAANNGGLHGIQQYYA